MEDLPKFCILCEPTGNNTFGKAVCVTRGLKKIIETSTSRGDNIKELLKTQTSIVVHVKCRKDYTRRTDSTSKKVDGTHETRRGFDFKSQCIFCEENVYDEVKKFRRQTTQKFSVVRTVEFIDNLRANANQRNDNWGERRSSQSLQCYRSCCIQGKVPSYLL